MDGDGSIQVNHWRSKNLAYRMVISLKDTKANEGMLKRVSKVVEGKVRKKDGDVLW